jgi:hypothetical protein
MNEIKLQIKINEKGSEFKVNGNANRGMVKILVGELENLKLRFLKDLHDSEDNGKPVERYG